VLHIHRADRSDVLVAALAEVLAEPLPDPMAFDVVAVPARGIERWITQQLSHRLGRTGTEAGVCAGVRFPSPAGLIAEVVGGREADPWTPDRLVWPVLSAIDASLTEPWAAILARYLGAGGEPGRADGRDRADRRYAVARRVAGLFDRYATNRPEMIADWRGGGDTDGAGRALPADLAWQPPLWRAVRDLVPAADPVHRVDGALTALAADQTSTALPSRLSLFGLSRLPALHARVISALAEHRDIHLWLPHPSDVLWRAVDSARGPAAARPSVAGARSADQTAVLARHPLLASLGRESRELQLGLPPAGTDLVHPVGRPGDGLLHRLQRDIVADRAPQHGVADPSDRSLTIHACHSPARQVDVLREVIVGLLQADPSLEPRDVLVLCPDIEQYAPLIAAGFGLAEVVDHGHPAHGLRVKLADRALRQTNGLLALAARLIDLAGTRFTATDVLDVAATPVVRRRFSFTDDDLATVSDWVSAVGIRWGVDGAHRAEYQLEAFGQNTWRAGLDRILLGVTMAETEHNWVGLALPLDDVGSAEIDLAGRFAEFVDRLGAAVDGLLGTRPVDQWLTRLGDCVEALADVPASEAWQRAELHRQLAVIVDEAGAAVGASLSLPDVRALLRSRLAGRPTRANFRTGTLTVCTMVPMRSVPHRVVCLLGLDDGVFPRNAAMDGDDILARDPQVGERDPRAEDRQLLLDAVLAATDHLVITYTGADDRTGSVRPPAVPLGELLSVLDDMVGDLEPPVLVRHPLQPYDPDVLIPGRLGFPGPFTFDPAARGAALAARATAAVPASAGRPGLVTDPLPDRSPTVVDLDDLIRLLHDPAGAFLRQRLQVAVPGDEALPSDSLPIEVDGLQKWAIGDALLRRRLAGVDLETCRQLEWRRGRVPPGRLGAVVLDEVCALVEDLVAAAAGPRAIAPAHTVDLVVPLAGDRQLRGTVGGIHATTVVRVGFSRLRPRDRLAAWIRLLALTAARPEEDWSAVTVGRAGRTGVGTSTVFAPEQGAAITVLGQLVGLYDRGLRTPLPIPERTACTYAEQRHAGAPADRAWEAAEIEWMGRNNFPGERVGAAAVLAWGAAAPMSVLAASPARPGSGWPGETSWFGATARRLWDPLLTMERSDR
jgi:exodeoxyribonuclease V gamma subunit